MTAECAAFTPRYTAERPDERRLGSAWYYVSMAVHNTIGEIGEQVAVEFLQERGFAIFDRNYSRKWGELDIVARKQGIVHFCEVKSTDCRRRSVTHETGRTRGYGDPQPEQHIDGRKVERLQRAVQTYLSEHFSRETPEWQVDVLVVYLYSEEQHADVKRLPNVVF